jgi:hypothetical protein
VQQYFSHSQVADGQETTATDARSTTASRASVSSLREGVSGGTGLRQDTTAATVAPAVGTAPSSTAPASNLEEDVSDGTELWQETAAATVAPDVDTAGDVAGARMQLPVPSLSTTPPVSALVSNCFFSVNQSYVLIVQFCTK